MVTCAHCGIAFDHAPMGFITFYRIIGLLVSCSTACYRELLDRYPPNARVQCHQNPLLTNKS